MKRFIVSVLCISVFFIGLGNVVEKAGAAFKSDEKALELLRKARQAVGGEAAIADVKSMTILGKATKTFEIEGAARTDQGDLEINFELPNKMSKMMKIGSGEGEANQLFDKRANVIVMNKDEGGNVQWKTESNEAIPGDSIKKIIIKKSDGTTEEVKTGSNEPIMLRRTGGDQTVVTSEDGKTVNIEGRKMIVRNTNEVGGGENFRSNELFRTTLSLLLTAPEGLDVTYTYLGEGSVDGNSCDIVSASDGGSAIKLYLDKSTSLPRMMTYQNIKPFMIKINKDETKPDPNGETKIFTRQLAEPEMAEFQVKFSDFRSAGGLQLPFKWTQTIGGKDDEITDITSYEINPANIADKFKEMPTKFFVRTKQ
ncbi:MAG: hypothetical protein ABJA66_05840 [Actinomycetota bacterium]